MKIGYRKPSIKSSVKARTTGKVKRTVKKTVNPLYGKKGVGYVKDPKKAIYNKVYNKTTIGVKDLYEPNKENSYNLYNHNNNNKNQHSSEKNTKRKKVRVPIGEHPTTLSDRIASTIVYLIIFAIVAFFLFLLFYGTFLIICLVITSIILIIFLIDAWTCKTTKDFKTKYEDELTEQDIQAINSYSSSNEKYNNKPMEKQQLFNVTNQQVNDDVRIAQESLRILTETLKPDVFFPRLDLLQNKLNHLKQLMPYINSDSSLTDAFDEFINNKQKSINQFIIRYFDSVQAYANTLKTEKGKANQYQKFYDTLMKYKDAMDEENIKYIEEEYIQFKG